MVLIHSLVSSQSLSSLHSSLGLSLVVEIAIEDSESKENKVLGIKITSERPLEGCPSPSPLPLFQPLL